MNKKRLEIFLEFLIFGIIMGVVEDLIAVTLATGEPITWRIVLIITLVAIPFAAIGELIVDRINLLSNDKPDKKKLKNYNYAYFI